MRLYHFTTARYALEAIRDQRLKVARIASLNDPFDVMATGGRQMTIEINRLGSGSNSISAQLTQTLSRSVRH